MNLLVRNIEQLARTPPSKTGGTVSTRGNSVARRMRWRRGTKPRDGFPPPAVGIDEWRGLGFQVLLRQGSVRWDGECQRLGVGFCRALGAGRAWRRVGQQPVGAPRVRFGVWVNRVLDKG